MHYRLFESYKSYSIGANSMLSWSYIQLNKWSKIEGRKTEAQTSGILTLFLSWFAC